MVRRRPSKREYETRIERKEDSDASWGAAYKRERKRKNLMEEEVGSKRGWFDEEA